MPKYAWYDPTVIPISPILGWYDTDTLYYTNLPTGSQLFTLTDDEWKGRFFNTFGVEDGEIVPCPPKSAI